ncbi:MAG: N-acetylornithine carbamoyltransferase [Flavobacteriaceae bacterium]|nr:N-acetylornithine carbamoyltransferase [Flavobacteriaceae bacterium]
MKHYTGINDIGNLQQAVKEALELKNDKLKYRALGKDKTICLLFFNNSLRTRLSTQKAAQNLGMDVIVMNFGSEGWALEYDDGTVMDQGKSEHVKEAAQVVSQYATVIGIRAFAGLEDKEKDAAELVLNSFVKYASVPIVNMESSLQHPLQCLTDAITMEEYKIVGRKPKVVLSWAPHPKALPHAVANSFINMMQLQDADFVITHPIGYELDPKITKDILIEYDQEKAFENADFVYVKNWSSYRDYGQIKCTDPNWMITASKMKVTNNGKFMHCLPVRRNVVVTDEVIDSKNSLVIKQAANREFAAQIVLKKILENDETNSSENRRT